ncbi:MAG: alanine racemase [Planctomycetota bacterium]
MISRSRVRDNLSAMAHAAGGPQRLRPHIKTHKMPQVISMKLDLGITRFKAATIAEVEMALRAGAADVMLAMQPVGIDAVRLAQLVLRFPTCRLSALIDDPGAARSLAAAALECHTRVPVYIDVNVGLNRTGISCESARKLYHQASKIEGIVPVGIHAYDGHLRSFAPEEIDQAVDQAFAPVWRLLDDLEADGFARPAVVGGGTASSISLARHPDIEVSAGTIVFWDAMQNQRWPGSPFRCAAMLAARVISHPRPDELCINLGHKAVASEMPHPRVQWLGIDDAHATGHSEEHLTIRTRHRDEFPVGTLVLGIPMHVCPTIALHDKVMVIEDARVVDHWDVVARSRHLSV